MEPLGRGFVTLWAASTTSALGSGLTTIAATLFVAAGGNCVGALLGGVIASAYGLTAPYWVGFVVAVAVAAATWRVFDRATVAQAYGEPAPAATR